MHLRHSVRLDLDSCLRNFGIDFNVQLFDFHEREDHGVVALKHLLQFRATSAIAFVSISIPACAIAFVSISIPAC